MHETISYGFRAGNEIRQIQDLLAADSLQTGEEYGVDLIPGMTIYNENQLTAEKIEACMKFQADSLKGELTPVYRWSQRAEESDALREKFTGCLYDRTVVQNGLLYI